MWSQALMFEPEMVFVDIDTQRDFLDPAGALYVPGAIEILGNLSRLNQFATMRGIPILATACAHRGDDPELKEFPPHCMIGTPGQERVQATTCSSSRVLAFDERLEGELPRHLTLQKHSLDVFSRADAGALIARYDNSKPRFVVYGVATDYCVRVNVEGLLKRGCRVAIVTDAIRAIDGKAEAGILT